MICQADARRIPLWVKCVKCVKCRHIWVGFYLPMKLSDVSRFKYIACPVCSANKNDVVLAKQKNGKLLEVEETTEQARRPKS